MIDFKRCPDGMPCSGNCAPFGCQRDAAAPLVVRLEAAGRDERLSTGALYLEAATALSLAQTEIKGHMRVEDELKATVASLERKLDDIVNTMKHAGMKVPGWIEHTGQDGKLRRDNLTIAATLMFELEARQGSIAELEKDAARYRFLAEQHNDWHVERWIDTMRGSGTWQSIRGTALGNAIDAALKSRA